MPGSSTTPGHPSACDDALGHVAFRYKDSVGTRISFLSRLNGWPARSPADASPTSSRLPAHGSGRCGSLFLHRSGLAPPTPCRLPAHLCENAVLLL